MWFLDVSPPFWFSNYHSPSHTRSPSFALFPRRHSAIHHTHTHTIQKGSHTPFSFTGRHRHLVCRNVDDLINRGNSHKTPADSKMREVPQVKCQKKQRAFGICCWLVCYWVVLECLFLCDHMSPSSRIPFTSETCLSADYFINPSASSDSFTASPQITVVLLHLIHWFSFS